MKKLLRNTFSRRTVLCLFLLFLGLLINTAKCRGHCRKLEKTAAKGNVFLEEKQSRFTQAGREICNQQIFNSYVSLHSQEKEKEFGRFLIYHILYDDVFGMGCRITGALYALALSISTNRVLVLSGVEFEYLFSSKLNFTRESLVRRAHKILLGAQIGSSISDNDMTYMKIEITPASYKHAKHFFMNDSLSQVNVLYANEISSHRHVDKLMAEDIAFRKNIIEIFGENIEAFSKENQDLMSHDRYKLVPEYPTVWRHIWGCAQWFLFDSMHPQIEELVAESFRSTNSEPCEKLISIHFRGGDTNFARMHSGREKVKDREVENMIDRWLRKVRTPIEALDIFLLYARRFRKEFGKVKVCYFVASDDIRAFNLTKNYVRDVNVLKTSGAPEHSSLSKNKTATLKALADYVVLGLSDVLIHGTSTYSESAIERTFGKNIEVKCRSPQKKLWSDVKSWYCIQKGKKVDQRAQKTIEYLKKNRPGILLL